METFFTLPVIIILSVSFAVGGLIIAGYSRFPLHRIYISKQRLESMLDAVTDPLAVISSDFLVLRANKAYSTLINRPFNEIIGQKCYQLFRDCNTPCSDCKLNEALGTNSTHFIDHSSHPSKPNGALAIAFTSFCERDNKLKPNCIIEHIRDISRLEQLKDNLEEKNHSLEKTTRELRAAQQNIRDELHLARRIQQGILPKKTPHHLGLKIAFTYHPIADVGGDIYDFIPFSQHRLGVFIGDASGHGLSSAFIATISKMSLFNHSRKDMATNILLSKMNDDLISNVHTSHYLTCFWCVIDNVKRTISYSRAGHPKPIVVRSTGEVFEMDCTGTFIGILESAEYEEREFIFKEHDRLYLFTDGLYDTPERTKDDNTMLGYDYFKSIVADCNALPFEKVLPSIQRHLPSHSTADDYTLIVIEFDNNEGK